MGRVCIIGARRGLGLNLVREGILVNDNSTHWLLTSRKMTSWEPDSLGFDSSSGASLNVNTLQVDMSRDEDLQTLLSELTTFKPSSIIYVAGGGPHGCFGSKAWKDHLWGLKVSFLSPAYLLHKVLADPPSTLEQMVFVGSSVAECQGDKGGASYAAAKSALYGLVASVVQENPPLDIRLLSPGYMDTDMLPQNAAVRGQQGAVGDPAQVAREAWQWMLRPKKSSSDWHLKL